MCCLTNTGIAEVSLQETWLSGYSFGVFQLVMKERFINIFWQLLFENIVLKLFDMLTLKKKKTVAVTRRCEGGCLRFN